MKIQNKKALNYLVGLYFFATLVSCSSTRSFEVSLNQDAYVSDSQQEAKLYSKGSSIQINPTSYTLIEAPGHLSVMIPPAEKLPEKMKVSLKPVPNWGQELVKKQVDEQLSDVFSQVNEIQSLLGEKQGDKALSKLEMLEKKYPGLISLKYLKIKSLLVLNRRRDARRELASSEEDFRENETGRKLIKFFEKTNKDLGENNDTNP